MRNLEEESGSSKKSSLRSHERALALGFSPQWLELCKGTYVHLSTLNSLLSSIPTCTCTYRLQVAKVPGTIPLLRWFSNTATALFHSGIRHCSNFNDGEEYSRKDASIRYMLLM